MALNDELEEQRARLLDFRRLRLHERIRNGHFLQEARLTDRNLGYTAVVQNSLRTRVVLRQSFEHSADVAKLRCKCALHLSYLPTADGLTAAAARSFPTNEYK